MGSSSGLLRLICRKGLAGSCNWISGKWATGFYSSSSWFKSANNSYRQMSTTNSSSSSSPWLMLPPEFEGGVSSSMMSYKFYSLAENRVELLDLVPNEDLRFKGSSHGWLALFNPINLDLFLYNPISRHHVKLPPIHDLLNFPDDHLSLRGVAKVIISCSPDEDEENCRAVMIYNCINALAFCCPGRSKEWTPIGDLYDWDENDGKRHARAYEDVVYSSRQKMFFCITDEGELETWDLRDPCSPRMVPMNKVDDEEICLYETEEEEKLRSLCRSVEHLVVNSHDLLVVTRYVMEHVGPDGSYVDFVDEGSENCPHKTVDFCIQKYDPDVGDFKRIDGSSLGGMVLFVGFYNHSVAMSPTEFPELKPNSIYFTDPLETPTFDYDDNKPFGGHDIGIFNYEDKTVSPCYYPCDVQSMKRIVPSPMWFFPSRPI